jgi:hypothetical protein
MAVHYLPINQSTLSLPLVEYDPIDEERKREKQTYWQKEVAEMSKRVCSYLFFLVLINFCGNMTDGDGFVPIVEERIKRIKTTIRKKNIT